MFICAVSLHWARKITAIPLAVWWLLYSSILKFWDESLQLLNMDFYTQNSSFCITALFFLTLRGDDNISLFYCFIMLETLLVTRGILHSIPKPVRKILKLNELRAVIPSTPFLELPLSGALSPPTAPGELLTGNSRGVWIYCVTSRYVCVGN